jgi:hypothetical protein
MGSHSGPKIFADDFTVRVFTSSGVFTPAFTGTIEVLVVGGGGGGGMDMGGGGGGGGVISNTTVSVTAGTPITVTVGAGGYGGPAGSGGYRTDGAGPQPGGHQFTVSATNGSNSVFGSLTAVGGGYGGSSYFGYTPNNGYGNAGGSGGGASGYSDGSTGRGGSGTAGQGNAGGGSTGQYYSGGGGGAAAAGSNGGTPNGGAGVLNTILNKDLYWGGGGGGASYSSGQGGNGGIGGGGGGANGTTTGGAGYNSGFPGGGGGGGMWAQTPGGNGGQFTGGGGGGGSHYNATNKGGEGGSGVVIVRYVTSLGTSTGGNTLGQSPLRFMIDSANRKSNIRSVRTSLINTSAWAVGASSVTDYGFNGSAGENALVAISDDPWGGNSIAWESRPSGNNEADGGWNTSAVSIDRTKLYRFSVWVRRTSSTTGGTFYLGTGGYGGEVVRTDNSAEQGNAYWECENIGALTQNVWYLVTGHIYPYGTTYTGRHPDTGMFTVAGGSVKARDVNGCNIGNDLKWGVASTGTLHRCYHYYCADNTSRLQFLDPRIDLCDGNQPTITDLLTKSPSKLHDTSGNGIDFSIVGYPTFSSSTGGVMQFTNAGASYAFNALNMASSSYTIITAARYSGSNRGRIVSSRSNNWLMGHWGSSTENYYAEGWVAGSGTGGPTPNDTNWRIIAATGNIATDNYILYVNGVPVSTQSATAGSQGPNGFQINGYSGLNELSDSEFGFVMAYNRVLTPGEIMAVFNTYRGRYGL